MKQMVPFKPGQLAEIFSGYVSPLAKAGLANLPSGGFAVVGYKGRAWSVRFRGKTELIEVSGTPVPYMEAVIVGVSSNISKRWYARRYEEGSSGAPDCWSADGSVPDPTSAQKQSANCVTCVRNQWGARVTESGKRAKECQDNRRIAIVPFRDLDNEVFGGPMLLSLPPMTINTFGAYCAQMEKLGMPLEAVVTRIGFDKAVSFPRITFEAVGVLDAEDSTKVVNEVMHSEQIARMFQEGTGGTEEDAAPAPAAEPEAKAEPVVVDMPKRKTASAFAAPAAKKAAAPAPLEETPADVAAVIDGLLADEDMAS